LSVTAAQEQFIESVLALAPRIAVFDADGTLWDADSGQEFFYWELERGLLPVAVAQRIRARYDEYLGGRVGETEMCGEMVQIHAGLREDAVRAAAREFYDTKIAPLIFPEMLALTTRLTAGGTDLWAVSSTNNWVVEAGVERFGIRAERVLAACIESHDGIFTDRLIQVPSDEGKADAIRAHIARPVDAVFGNSVHDAAMLRLARHAFAINPSPELEQEARVAGWTVYRPVIARDRS
jgi:phosphoserine phosphatase